MYLWSFFVVVTLQELSYTVREISELLTVCMTVTGVLERNVTFTVSTADGSATGTLIYLIYITVLYIVYIPV